MAPLMGVGMARLLKAPVSSSAPGRGAATTRLSSERRAKESEKVFMVITSCGRQVRAMRARMGDSATLLLRQLDDPTFIAEG